MADGLHANSFEVPQKGGLVNAEDFNALMADPDTLCLDMRNHYESEIGHFEGAILPEAESFKEELPMVLEKLKGKENRKILLYTKIVLDILNNVMLQPCSYNYLIFLFLFFLLNYKIVKYFYDLFLCK